MRKILFRPGTAFVTGKTGQERTGANIRRSDCRRSGCDSPDVWFCTDQQFLRSRSDSAQCQSLDAGFRSYVSRRDLVRLIHKEETREKWKMKAVYTSLKKLSLRWCRRPIFGDFHEPEVFRMFLILKCRLRVDCNTSR